MTDLNNAPMPSTHDASYNLNASTKEFFTTFFNAFNTANEFTWVKRASKILNKI